MKQRKSRIAALALLLIVIAAAAVFALRGRDSSAPLEGNLLKNADFSAVTDGMPDHWEKGMWVTSVGASYLEAVTLEGGVTAALVENVAANDARFEQTVSVRPNATYKLTARVMAEGCDAEKLGANVSFLGIYGTSETVHDTQGQWETITLYGQTGKGQKEITVCARVGGYGSEAAGKAWFTDMELTEVSDVPVGVSVLNLATPEPQKEQKAENGESAGLFSKDNAIPLVIGAALIYLAIAAAIVQICLRPRNGLQADGVTGAGLALLSILMLGFIVRYLLALGIEGYGVDMGCFSAWAGKMASGGPMNFYEEGYFCDYPPAYMLVLGAIGLIANAANVALGSMQMQVLLKMVPILCDIALAAVLYRVSARRMGQRAALGMAALMALNPAFIIGGSCWGQIDSVLAILLLVMLLCAQEGRWRIAIPVFALAVLAKPQAGLLAPLGVAALVKDVREKRSIREILYGIGGAVLVTLAVVIPFSIHQENPLWLVDTYVKTLQSYDYATLSTGNLMFLLGGNWVAGNTAVLGPVTYGTLGLVLMAASFVIGIVVYMKGKGRESLFLASALTMQLIFVLGSKMHERYILPALALMLVAYALTRDVRVLASAVIASAATAVNVGVVLAYDYLIAPNLWLGYIIGALQLISAALMAWACVDIVWRGHVMALPVRSIAQEEADDGEHAPVYAADVRMRNELLHAPEHGLRMTRRDWLLMLALTAVYAVIGFYGLGTNKAPQDGYVSTLPGESVVIDLGERREDFRIYYYGGISDTGFSFAVSDDGVFYEAENDAFFDRGECFKWQAQRTPVYKDGKVSGASGDMRTFSGRYLRVTFEDAGSALWEVAAVDETGSVYPVVGAQAFGARDGRGDDPAKLVDEQDTVPAQPSYLNSMYFDEIYHARTGYEHANSLHTYETTHPPLGKVFMGICIDLMGMTPFAWRFAGALTGVLMIPAMYLLAKLLLGTTLYAFLCAFLMSVDCMHFTQTRIATIDSFPVLFIMLMFLCMAYWMK
ncbi:MAG: glycosyltransferase family 39 protein, partial [Clostridia bacterium]|nr:glycosyltransferase family 39 protein [Clostridia bacterium]